MLWIKFALIVGIVFVCIFSAKLLFRKIFKIKKVKKEFFSHNHINELHKKVDKGLKLFSTVTMGLLLGVMWFYFEVFSYLFFIAIIFFAVLDYLVRAFFEWKYTQYPKQSILTLTEMFLILIAAVVVFQFNFFI